MAFPDGWPPRPSSGLRSIRFYQPLTAATANFVDRAYLFIDGAGANTFQPTPPLDAGDETNPTPVGVPDPVFDASGSPLGAGRSPGDAYPFAPNLFQREAGGTTAFAVAGSTVTFTDSTPAKPFKRDLVGKEMRILNATTVGNDGTFRIASVPDEHTLTWVNSAGVTEAGAGTYRIRTLSDAVPKAMIWAQNISITSVTAAIEVSFDGINVQGIVPVGTTKVYRNRFEAGVAVRGSGGSFIIEAW